MLSSRTILEELVRVMTIKLPEGLPALKVLLTNVPPEIIPDPPIEESGQWKGYLLAGDALILAAAISARPDYFVTGDSHSYKFLSSIIEQAGVFV